MKAGGAAAAMCMDHNGQFLGSNAVVFPHITDPRTLGALACHEALALALDLSVDRVIISCDCKPVISEIKDGTEGTCGTIIR